MSENMDQVLSWDDEIRNDGKEFRVVPEGEFNFKVTNFEKGTYQGSAKMSQSPMAIMTLEVETDDGKIPMKDKLILNRVMEWKLSSFLRSIGQKKHGESVRPKWNQMVGSVGRAYFKPSDGDPDKNGNVRQFSNVDHYIDYDPEYFRASTKSEPASDDDDDFPF